MVTVRCQIRVVSSVFLGILLNPVQSEDEFGGLPKSKVVFILGFRKDSEFPDV